MMWGEGKASNDRLAADLAALSRLVKARAAALSEVRGGAAAPSARSDDTISGLIARIERRAIAGMASSSATTRERAARALATAFRLAEAAQCIAELAERSERLRTAGRATEGPCPDSRRIADAFARLDELFPAETAVGYERRPTTGLTFVYRGAA